MNVISVRNVHEALPEALRFLRQTGVPRDSRNGAVLQAPCPVTTVYRRPDERVLFWPERDANPFFHFMESLWMLAGRNDVAWPADLAAPYGVVNVFDVMAFVDLYNQQSQLADLVDNDIFNIFDIMEYINLYNQGCP